MLAGLVGECPYAEKPRQPAAGSLERPLPARGDMQLIDMNRKGSYKRNNRCSYN
jgi:hypothetical protein